MSLGVLSKVLIAQNHHVEAERALHEAVTLLSPLFLNAYAPFHGLMEALCRGYEKTCEAQKHEPDMELLAPIIAVFEQLQEKAT